jgi:phenylacetate-CoA ligase
MLSSSNRSSSQEVLPAHDRRLTGLQVIVVGNFNRPESGTVYQAEVLANMFERDGASVLRVSFVQNRWLRPLDITLRMWRYRDRYSMACIQAFSFGNWINAAVAIMMASVLRKTSTLVYRGGGFREFVQRYGWAVLPLLRRVDCLITPSAFLAEELRRHGLAPYVIPNVIEVRDWPFRSRTDLKPRLIWVRHLRRGYNPWMAVEVLQRLQKRHPDASLTMAGDGEMEHELRERIKSEGIQGVDLVGHIPAERLRQLYNGADIFISTTNYDNQPRSVLEAMACGLPVISTNVGGVPFLIEDGTNGLLVSAGDAPAMAAAAEALLSAPVLVQALSLAGRKTATSHGWDSCGIKWAEAFELAAKRHPN